MADGTQAERRRRRRRATGLFALPSGGRAGLSRSRPLSSESEKSVSRETASVRAVRPLSLSLSLCFDRRVVRVWGSGVWCPVCARARTRGARRRRRPPRRVAARRRGGVGRINPLSHGMISERFQQQDRAANSTRGSRSSGSKHRQYRIDRRRGVVLTATRTFSNP